jgi:hypothetical protein
VPPTGLRLRLQRDGRQLKVTKNASSIEHDRGKVRIKFKIEVIDNAC